MKELLNIQSELKAPKNNYNSFGRYNYRSCEDILEAVKPLCAKNKCTLTISDDIEVKGNRNYVKSTATLKNEKGESESVSASACEAETKKGMDSAQITGSASSYARKYALNGLFAIDDTKDADSTNKHGKDDKKPEPEKPKRRANSKPDLKVKQEEVKAGLKNLQHFGATGFETTDEILDFIKEQVGASKKTSELTLAEANKIAKIIEIEQKKILKK